MASPYKRDAILKFFSSASKLYYILFLLKRIKKEDKTVFLKYYYWKSAFILQQYIDCKKII